NAVVHTSQATGASGCDAPRNPRQTRADMSAVGAFAPELEESHCVCRSQAAATADGTVSIAPAPKMQRIVPGGSQSNANKGLQKGVTFRRPRRPRKRPVIRSSGSGDTRGTATSMDPSQVQATALPTRPNLRREESPHCALPEQEFPKCLQNEPRILLPSRQRVA